MKTQLTNVKQILAVACLACLILSGVVYGQDPPQRPATEGGSSRGSGGRGGSTTNGDRANPLVLYDDDEDYKLAPKDVIEIIVEDAQELTTNYTIQSNGIIPLRFLGATKVAGLTTNELGNIITNGLRDRYLKDPKVYVSVKQYNSRTFFVQGAVRSPGAFVIAGKPSLFRLLTIAGGLQDNHGLNAFIFREVKPKPEKIELGSQQQITNGANTTTTPDDNSKLKEIANNAKGIETGTIDNEQDIELITANIGGIIRGRMDNNIIIQPGDVVYVPPGDVFYVSGEVKSPGAFPLRQGITLRQAITLAGGAFFKSNLEKGVIFRTDPVTGNFSEVQVDIGAVISGKQADVPIMGNDVIWVPNSKLKSLGATLYNSLLPLAIFRIPLGR